MTKEERFKAFLMMQIRQNKDRKDYAVRNNLLELQSDCDLFDDLLRSHPVMQEGGTGWDFQDTSSSFPRSKPSQDLDTHSSLPPDYIKGIDDFPSGLQDLTNNFIEHARDAEMKLISELFKTTTGEELTEQNAHRVCIDYGINRSISIDGVIIGRFKQDMLPTDNGYKCSITFVPASPRSAPTNDPGAHSMNIV